MLEIVTAEADLKNPRHQEAIVALIDSYARDPQGNVQGLPEEVRRTMARGLRDHPTSWVLLAFHDERPVGVAVCFVGFSTFAAKPLINVHDLVVLSDFRRKAVGRRLLDHVEDKARELGCCKITLEVREGNDPARKLYHKVGFSRTKDGAEPERTLFLEKFL